MVSLRVLAVIGIYVAVAYATQCANGSNCAGTQTCCANGSGGYGCCPYTSAVCCPDHIHCCPQGSTCSNGNCMRPTSGGNTAGNGAGAGSGSKSGGNGAGSGSKTQSQSSANSNGGSNASNGGSNASNGGSNASNGGTSAGGSASGGSGGSGGSSAEEPMPRMARNVHGQRMMKLRPARK